MNRDEFAEFRRECAPHLYTGEQLSPAEQITADRIADILGTLAPTPLRAQQIVRRAIDDLYGLRAGL